MLVTERILRRHGACAEWRRKFKTVFPDGLEWSREGIIRALYAGFGKQIKWLIVNHPNRCDEMPDLSGANLSNISLRGAILTNLNLTGAKFEGSDLTGAEFDDSKLDRASFRGATLDGASFFGASLQRASFCRARLTDVDFFEADLTGASWELAYYRKDADRGTMTAIDPKSPDTNT